MNALQVTGIGLWAPGFPGVPAWLAGAAQPGPALPSAVLLPAAVRRRATTLTALASQVALEASRQGGAALDATPLVLGSAHGEIAIAVQMMGAFGEGEGLPSPTSFHNSVHHTAAAYLSMAAGFRGFATALAAGPATPAAALLEARAWLAERGGEVLVVLADEPVPAPLGPLGDYPPAAVALLLRAGGPGAALATLEGPALGPPARPRVGGLPALEAHPCAGGFALVDAISRRAAGAVPVGEAAGGGGWWAHVHPGAGP